jgi:hypothetical protein
MISCTRLFAFTQERIMTEYEMASLFGEYTIASTTLWGLFLSLTTGFLIAAYNTAHKLTTTMAWIVVTGWAVVGAGVALQIVQWAWIADALRGQMKEYASAGKGLAWHPAISSIFSWSPGPGRAIGLGVVLALLLIASIIFFFHCRRVNRKAETGA